MSADPDNHDNREEQQRRELEEIRNSFTKVGIRMGSLFEPAGDSDEPDEVQGSLFPELESADAGHREPKALAPRPRPERQVPRWAASAVIALVCLLAGSGLGYLLHSPAPGPAPDPIVVTHTVPKLKIVSPPACLETAKRGDQSMDLLLRNVRDRRLSLALKAYTVASQACRKEASP
jgi:hypothetical protein